MTLTIIIPTKNEADYLPKLLDSILNQKNVDLSQIPIIIADNHSTDGTVEIAQNFGQKGLQIKIIEGGLPAQARNNGAKTAKTQWLWFIDSDVILEADTLSKYQEQTQNPQHKIYTSYVSNYTFAPQSWVWFIGYNAILKLKDIVFGVTQNIIGGWNILISKDDFEQVGGFDTTINTHEDIKLARHFKPNQFGVIQSKIKISPRRFKRDGFWKVFWLYNKVFWRTRFGSNDYNDNDNQDYFSHNFDSKK
jgi:glycosyltransferase involved in cell wall biosynthesis